MLLSAREAAFATTAVVVSAMRRHPQSFIWLPPLFLRLVDAIAPPGRPQVLARLHPNRAFESARCSNAGSLALPRRIEILCSGDASNEPSERMTCARMQPNVVALTLNAAA